MTEEQKERCYAKMKELAQWAKEKNIDKETWMIAGIFAGSDIAKEMIGDMETVVDKMLEATKTCETEQEFLDTIFDWVGL